MGIARRAERERGERLRRGGWERLRRVSLDGALALALGSELDEGERAGLRRLLEGEELWRALEGAHGREDGRAREGESEARLFAYETDSMELAVLCGGTLGEGMIFAGRKRGEGKGDRRDSWMEAWSESERAEAAEAIREMAGDWCAGSERLARRARHLAPKIAERLIREGAARAEAERLERAAPRAAEGPGRPRGI